MGFGAFKEGRVLNGYAIDLCLGEQSIRPMLFDALNEEVKRYNLKWTNIKFVDANRSQIPDEPGVYFFSIRPRVANIEEHHVILYVGRAKISLLNRYKDYLQEGRNRGATQRRSVVDMLNVYRDRLTFSYVCVDMHSTEHLEDSLIMGLDPPCNTVKLPFPAFRKS